jgi:hypothetical protein
MNKYINVCRQIEDEDLNALNILQKQIEGDKDVLTTFASIGIDLNKVYIHVYIQIHKYVFIYVDIHLY